MLMPPKTKPEPWQPTEGNVAKGKATASGNGKTDSCQFGSSTVGLAGSFHFLWFRYPR